MSGSPITQPARILTTALYAALSPLVESVRGVPAACWLQAPQQITDALTGGTLPGMLVYQPQTALSDAPFINGAEVTATIAVRALALSDDAAQDLLADAVRALAQPLHPPAGYAVQMAWGGELVIPPRDRLFTAVALYRATIRRA